jgi:glycosyltransferase involved in cell wall biosynthesis
MLCGCIPIGSAVGGIPDIIGDAGFILYKKDGEQFRALVREALACDKMAMADKASRRIREKYPPGLRKDQLTSLINNLIGK